MSEFIKGLELSEIFYREAVAPLLASEFPGLRHGAARLDYCSDVLGFDSPRSMDHDWGPRLMLFLAPEDLAVSKDKVLQMLSKKLPLEIRGYSTNFGKSVDGTSFMLPVQKGPVDHRVTITALPDFARDYLGLETPLKLQMQHWLSLPQQRLCTLASGKIFHDGLGDLNAFREALVWYPHELWLHMMACQWEQIAQEEPFVGRCGESGDELGSKVVAARLVKQLIQLAFLMEKSWRPYSKWLGMAFRRLNCAGELSPVLDAVLASQHWKDRESHLSKAYSLAAGMHNSLGLTPALSTGVETFYHRPYLVIKGNRFAEALRKGIKSPEIKALPKGLGGIDQITDNVDILENLERCRQLMQGICERTKNKSEREKRETGSN